MTAAAVLDRLALLACASSMAIVLAWIVFHPIIAVFLQIAMVLGALVWRFVGVHPAGPEFRA